jgi:secondary thiamine-phosphate synthase enzyme
MKSHNKEIITHISSDWGYANITDQVQNVIDESKVKEGLVHVSPIHITASVFINDDDEGLHHDFEKWLEKLAPHAPSSQHKHINTGEDKPDAHLKRQAMSREVAVAIIKGKLDLHMWEHIFYGEHDGKRKRKVMVKIIGE